MNSNIPGKPDEALPGPILLDGFLQSFLLGTIVNQAFKYWVDYRDDSWRRRIFVTSVIILSILQTMLEDYKVWRTLIMGKRWSTSRIEWSDLFLNGCICWLCEGFYIKRCWKMMDRSVWVLAPLSVLSILIMAANVYLAIAMGIAFRSLEGTDDTLTASHFLLPSTIVAFSFWIFGSLILETVVTVILLISLWRSRTGFQEVDKALFTVIHLTWESAVLPSICMIIAVGLYHATPRVDDHLVLFFVLLTGKFYTFGMLRTLNYRAKLRRKVESHELGRTSLSTDWTISTDFPTKKRKHSGQTSSAEESACYFSPCTFTYRVSKPQLDAPGPTAILDTDNDIPGSPSISHLGSSGHLTTSVQLNTPSMEAQERGMFSGFRNRVYSADLAR